MIPPFHRRDTGCNAVAVGLVVGGFALAYAPQSPSVAAASVGLALLLLGMLLRNLPPDLRLRPLSEAAARVAAAPPSPGLARLRVALLPEPLSWFRLDLHLDGVRIAQLRPGTAAVLPMALGAHVLTMRVGLRWLGSGEMINALPGTDYDTTIRSSGGKVRKYAIERRDLGRMLAGRRVLLVESG